MAVLIRWCSYELLQMLVTMLRADHSPNTVYSFPFHSFLTTRGPTLHFRNCFNQGFIYLLYKSCFNPLTAQVQSIKCNFTTVEETVQILFHFPLLFQWQWIFFLSIFKRSQQKRIFVPLIPKFYAKRISKYSEYLNVRVLLSLLRNISFKISQYDCQTNLGRNGLSSS